MQDQTEDKRKFRMLTVIDEFTRRCLCLLYTSDAADDLLCVDLGGRRIIKKNNTTVNSYI